MNGNKHRQCVKPESGGIKDAFVCEQGWLSAGGQDREQ